MGGIDIALDPSPGTGEGRVEAQPRAGVGSAGPRSRIETSRALRKRMTPQEVKLWVWLRESVVPTGYHFRRQVPIDRFIVDFACRTAKLVVEVDGGQHGSASGRARDEDRNRRLAKLGFQVIRSSNSDVDRDKQMALDTIRAHLLERSVSSPPRSALPTRPSPGGEGSGRGSDA